MGDEAALPAASAWRRRPGYLDTATYGLPPTATVELGHRVLEEWADGSADWREWNDAADQARRSFAALVGVEPDTVAAGSAGSGFFGAVASSLPDDAEVIVPERDFTSLLYPFLVQASRGVRVRAVPLEALADAVSTSTTVVAWSAVQSVDGRIADVDAILEATGRVGAMTVVDATQALPWLPLPLHRLDATICSAYKWLCCPRGTAFMVASPATLQMCVPHGAGWFAAPDMYSAFYGLPLRLATTARRLDASPVWHAWTGAVTTLDVLRGIGVEAMHTHDVALADELRDALDLPSTGSAIISIVGAEAGLERSLAAAGIKAATRADGCRLSFHVYNDRDDVAAVRAALAGRVRVAGA
jgi:selenocysteine lyase/cysteine desulfurase